LRRKHFAELGFMPGAVAEVRRDRCLQAVADAADGVGELFQIRTPFLQGWRSALQKSRALRIKDAAHIGRDRAYLVHGDCPVWLAALNLIWKSKQLHEKGLVCSRSRLSEWRALCAMHKERFPPSQGIMRGEGFLSWSESDQILLVNSLAIAWLVMARP
jgi:hypothetical protein